MCVCVQGGGGGWRERAREIEREMWVAGLLDCYTAREVSVRTY